MSAAVVGVNLLWLVPGVVGGSEDATVRLLHAIADVAPSDLDVVLFGLPELADAHPDLTARFPTELAPTGGGRKPLRVVAESTWLPRAARRRGVGLLHHAGGVVPPGARLPATVTVHDLQPFDLPEHFSSVKRAYLRVVQGPSVRRARITAVPSEFTRRRVIEHFAVPADRVVVVPWSVPAAHPVGVVGVSGRFVLYPAITYPHKDHATLLDAMARVVAEHADVTLVLTGGDGPCASSVAQRLARPDLAGRAVHLGRVSEGERDALLQAAAVVAVPSRYEGFGLPALEAMAAGVPVVAASAGALPEVVDGAGSLVTPGDAAGFATAISQLLDDPALCAARAAAGRVVAARSTPTRTASAMLDVWRRALPHRTTSAT